MASDSTAPAPAAPKRGLLSLIADAADDAASMLETAGGERGGELAKRLRLRGGAGAARVIEAKVDEARAAKTAFDQSAIPVAARAVKAALDERKRQVAADRAEKAKRGGTIPNRKPVAK